MPLKRLLVLASHEPNLDPRIDWISRFATNLFQVTVYGISDPSRPEMPITSQHGYQIERHGCNWNGLNTFAYTSVRRFAKSPLMWLLVSTVCLLSVFVLLFGLPLALVFWVACKLKHRLTSRHLGGVDLIWRQLARVGRPRWLIYHFLGTAVSLFREARRAPRPDVIYCNDLDTLLAGVLLRSFFGCKLIYDAHEFWAHSDPASSSAEVKFFLFYERKLLAHVDAAYTVNHLLAEQMHAALGHDFGSLPNCEPVHSFAEQGICSISQGVIAPTMNPGESDGKKTTAEIAEGRVIFLYQGAFAPKRGILELVSVWGGVDSSKAVLFLRGPDNEDKTACMDRAREIGVLDKSVFFPEPVREYDLVAAAAEADVGIIPYKAVTVNYRFCCPNKLSQYMQAGLAILANELDFVKYAIERYQCGVTYDVNDPTNILAAINRLINDESFRHACQKQAKKMFVQEYNWENVSKSLYETCARLADLKTGAEHHEVKVARVA